MPAPTPVTAEDLDIAARTLYGECRGEPLRGQQAVAWVIRNRALWTPPAWWGHSVATVCRQPFQFSCWNSNDPNCAIIKTLAVTHPMYVMLLGVVQAVMVGSIDDPTGGATHYQMIGTGAAWARNRPISAIIGHHEFYAVGPSA